MISRECTSRALIPVDASGTASAMPMSPEDLERVKSFLTNKTKPCQMCGNPHWDVLPEAVAWIVWKPLDSALGRSFGAQVVSLGLALAAALCTYLIGCRALRVRELDTLTSVWSRLRRT